MGSQLQEPILFAFARCCYYLMSAFSTFSTFFPGHCTARSTYLQIPSGAGEGEFDSAATFGAIIIHTASVLVFDWDMLWTNPDEILCVHLSQRHTYLQSNSKVQPEDKAIYRRESPAYYLLSVLPASITIIKHSFGSRLPWLSSCVLCLFGLKSQ